MYYVYILLSLRDFRFYTGLTNDISRRLKEHMTGHTHSTKRMGELKLIYYEVFINQEDAKRRERYFKTTKGKKTLKLMLRDTLLHSGVV